MAEGLRGGKERRRREDAGPLGAGASGRPDTRGGAGTPEVGSGEIEVVLGNSNSRFSGVTSTMLQVLPEQMRHMRVAVMGDHHLPPDVPSVSFLDVARLARTPLSDGRPRVFHARRNDEMIQGLLLKRVFGADLRIVFTSTAQRHHTWLTNWLMKRMDGLLSTCEAAAAYMKHPPDRIVPHGVDTRRFHPAPDRAAAWRALGLPGERGVGIFGRVRRQKGVDVLLEAVLPLLPDHPGFTVVVVGEVTPSSRDFADDLERRVADEGLSDRVVFLGKQPFDRIPDIFRAMSIVTALSRNEGFGLTVLEAMSSGVPVVASEAGAWPEIVEDGVDGWLVPVGDVDATRDRLGALMAHPDGLDAMGARGRAKVLAGFTVEREARELCDYYADLSRGAAGRDAGHRPSPGSA